MTDTVTLLNKTRSHIPNLPVEAMKDATISARYSLSLSFITPKEMRRITLATRGYDKASNVLSFPFDNRSGEILICPHTARREAHEFDMDYANFLAYLVIHGLCHLSGLDHGAIMERKEQRIMARFGIVCKNSSPASTSAHTKLK